MDEYRRDPFFGPLADRAAAHAMAEAAFLQRRADALVMAGDLEGAASLQFAADDAMTMALCYGGLAREVL